MADPLTPAAASRAAPALASVKILVNLRFIRASSISSVS
jgi:hypothetical protein